MSKMVLNYYIVPLLDTSLLDCSILDFSLLDCSVIKLLIIRLFHYYICFIIFNFSLLDFF